MKYLFLLLVLTCQSFSASITSSESTINLSAGEESLDISVQIEAESDKDVKIALIQLGDFLEGTVGKSNCPINLEKGTSCSFDVKLGAEASSGYKYIKVMGFEGSDLLSQKFFSKKLKIKLNRIEDLQKIEFSQSTLNFGDMAKNEKKSSYVRIRNIGEQDSQPLNNFKKQLKSPFKVSLDLCSGKVLKKGSSCLMKIEANTSGLFGGTYEQKIEAIPSNIINKKISLDLSLNVTGPTTETKSLSLSLNNDGQTVNPSTLNANAELRDIICLSGECVLTTVLQPEGGQTSFDITLRYKDNSFGQDIGSVGSLTITSLDGDLGSENTIGEEKEILNAITFTNSSGVSVPGPFQVKEISTSGLILNEISSNCKDKEELIDGDNCSFNLTILPREENFSLEVKALSLSTNQELNATFSGSSPVITDGEVITEPVDTFGPISLTEYPLAYDLINSTSFVRHSRPKEVNGTLYFIAYAPFHGTDFFKVNENGKIVAMRAGLPQTRKSDYGLGSAWDWLVSGDKIFMVYDFYNNHGNEVYVYNTTSNEFYMLGDFWPGESSGVQHNYLAELNGKVYFKGKDSSGPSLWESDGTIEGTSKILDLSIDLDNLYSGKDYLFATAISPTLSKTVPFRISFDQSGNASLQEFSSPDLDNYFSNGGTVFQNADNGHIQGGRYLLIYENKIAMRSSSSTIKTGIAIFDMENNTVDFQHINPAGYNKILKWTINKEMVYVYYEDQDTYRDFLSFDLSTANNEKEKLFIYAYNEAEHMINVDKIFKVPHTSEIIAHMDKGNSQGREFNLIGKDYHSEYVFTNGVDDYTVYNIHFLDNSLENVVTMVNHQTIKGLIKINLLTGQYTQLANHKDSSSGRYLNYSDQISIVNGKVIVTAIDPTMGLYALSSDGLSSSNNVLDKLQIAPAKDLDSELAILNGEAYFSADSEEFYSIMKLENRALLKTNSNSTDAINHESLGNYRNFEDLVSYNGSLFFFDIDTSASQYKILSFDGTNYQDILTLSNTFTGSKRIQKMNDKLYIFSSDSLLKEYNGSSFVDHSLKLSERSTLMNINENTFVLNFVGNSSNQYTTGFNYGICLDFIGDYQTCDYCSSNSGSDSNCGEMMHQYMDYYGINLNMDEIALLDFQACTQAFPYYECDDARVSITSDVWDYDSQEAIYLAFETDNYNLSSVYFDSNQNFKITNLSDHNDEIDFTDTISANDNLSFYYLGDIGNDLYFSYTIYKASNGSRMFKTVKVDKNTKAVTEISNTDSAPLNFDKHTSPSIDMGEQIVFAAINDSGLNNLHGKYFLINSEGMEEISLPGKILFDDVQRGYSEKSYYMGKKGDYVYLRGEDNSTTGVELYKYHPANKTLEKFDIYPGAGGSSPMNFYEAKGQLFFVASSPSEGAELWRINESNEPEIALDIVPGPEDSLPNYLNYDEGSDKMFFIYSKDSKFSIGNIEF